MTKVVFDYIKLFIGLWVAFVWFYLSAYYYCLGKDWIKNTKFRSQYSTLNENFSCEFNESIFDMKTRILDTGSSSCIVNYFEQLRPFREMKLSSDGERIANSVNAGGSSIVSEALSFEMLRASFGAMLHKTEMEICYRPNGPITDYCCCLIGSVFGVSVTRAMSFRGTFTAGNADGLLKKKLKGINGSTKNSTVKWIKQVLHVWTENDKNAELLIKSFNSLESEVKSNTTLVITITNCREIFENK